MCFNQPVSIAFAVCLWTFALVWRGDRNVRLCVVYFALMETLQAAQYSVIDQCSNPWNQFLTFLGFVHLAFQPLFVNLYMSAFMNRKQRAYLPLITTLCAFAGVLLLNRMWITKGDYICQYNLEPLCGEKMCTFRGDVHLAWQAPAEHSASDYFTFSWSLHFFTFFLPTFALGMWPFTLFLLFSGPVAGRMLTKMQDEIPAIWCLFSIVQVVMPVAYAAYSDPQGATAFFRKRREQQQAAAVAPSKKAAEDDVPEPFTTAAILRRSLGLFIMLTVKRFATIIMNHGVGAAMNPMEL